MINPEDWNNIPIPLTEAATQLIKGVQMLSKLQEHMKGFLNDIVLVSNNVLIFAEASCDDMRDRVAARVAMLNEKSESEVIALQKHQEKYCKDQIAENNWDINDKLKDAIKALEARSTALVEKRAREVQISIRKETE